MQAAVHEARHDDALEGAAPGGAGALAAEQIGKALSEWKAAVVEDLGGPEGMSTMEAEMVAIAARSKLILDSVDGWLRRTSRPSSYSVAPSPAAGSAELERWRGVAVNAAAAGRLVGSATASCSRRWQRAGNGARARGRQEITVTAGNRAVEAGSSGGAAAQGDPFEAP